MQQRLTRNHVPSPATEDAAVRLFRRGILGTVRLSTDPHGTERYQIPSATRDGVAYALTHYPATGLVECSCPAGERGYACKHLALIQFARGWVGQDSEWFHPDNRDPADVEQVKQHYDEQRMVKALERHTTAA